MVTTERRFTVADLEHMPEDGRRYEVIEGELYVTAAPHSDHQQVIGEIEFALRGWDRAKVRGRTIAGARIIFSLDNGVIPDLVWARDNEERDRETKLTLYSRRGVQEYWIVDREAQTLAVYRRQADAALTLALTLTARDTLTSPLLPEFSLAVAQIFSLPDDLPA